MWSLIGVALLALGACLRLSGCGGRRARVLQNPQALGLLAVLSTHRPLSQTLSAEHGAAASPRQSPTTPFSPAQMPLVQAESTQRQCMSPLQGKFWAPGSHGCPPYDANSQVPGEATSGLLQSSPGARHGSRPGTQAPPAGGNGWQVSSAVQYWQRSQRGAPRAGPSGKHASPRAAEATHSAPRALGAHSVRGAQRPSYVQAEPAGSW
jgi:hypothetical protein